MSKSIRWFGPKRIGWGVRPIHPMGYLVLVISIAGLIAGINLIVTGSSFVVGILIALVSILFFIIVSALTFDKATST